MKIFFNWVDFTYYFLQEFLEKNAFWVNNWDFEQELGVFNQNFNINFL